jgi:hypothetical protein
MNVIILAYKTGKQMFLELKNHQGIWMYSTVQIFRVTSLGVLFWKREQKPNQ